VKPVQIGPSVGGVTVVESGLADGEQVVTGGQYKLRKDAEVSITDKVEGGDGNS
jgi:membrane fusion protein, multidrug efflux system